MGCSKLTTWAAQFAAGLGTAIDVRFRCKSGHLTAITSDQTLLPASNENLPDGNSCRSRDLQILCRCLTLVGYFFVLNGLPLSEGA